MKPQARYTRWGVKPEADGRIAAFPLLSLVQSPKASLPKTALPHRQIRRFANASAPGKSTNGLTGGRLIEGICVPFGVVLNVEGGPELYQYGCFANSLANDDPLVILNTNVGYVLGRKSAGTARFSESRSGLKFDCDVPETGYGDDLLVSMKRGDISGADSVFFIENYSMKQIDGRNVRVVDQAKLIAAAVASFPTWTICNSETTAAIAAAKVSGFELGLSEGRKTAKAEQGALRNRLARAQASAMGLATPIDRTRAEFQRRLTSAKR